MFPFVLAGVTATALAVFARKVVQEADAVAEQERIQVEQGAKFFRACRDEYVHIALANDRALAGKVVDADASSGVVVLDTRRRRRATDRDASKDLTIEVGDYLDQGPPDYMDLTLVRLRDIEDTQLLDDPE